MAVESPDAVAVTVAFQAALAKLSVEAAGVALKWWRASLGDGGAVPSGEAIVAPLRGMWGVGARLGVAYFRLLRALETGRTVPDPLHPQDRRSRVSLGALVADFERATKAPLKLKASLSYSVAVEPESGLDGRTLLAARDEDMSRAAGKIDDRLAEAKAKGRAVAPSDGIFASGAGQEFAANGARTTVARMGRKDKRLIGWIRVSSTGSPCAYCAMLMSRGAVYRSKESASGGGGAADRFHPHCHCIARPIYSDRTRESGRYALNQQYWADWKTLSDRLGRSPTASDWRRFFYKRHGR